jgi:hypothetical protein
VGAACGSGVGGQRSVAGADKGWCSAGSVTTGGWVGGERSVAGAYEGWLGARSGSGLGRRGALGTATA